MKLLAIILLLVAGCSKPDETIYEPTPDLVCVDCWDQLSDICFLDVFCGTSDEADRFITEAKAAAIQKGMYLYCIKKN